MRPTRVRRARRAHAPADRRERRHLQRLCRPAGRRPALGARSAAVRAAAPTNGAHIEAGVAQRARLLERVACAISTARSGCSPKGTSPPSCRSAIRTSSGPATASCPPTATGCTSTPPTWRARPTAAGGCSPTARRRPPARATRWRTARSSRRCFPTPIRDMSRAARARLLRRAARAAARRLPRRGESPLAVLLTPGPYNETYFEHAYLARQLGFRWSRAATSRCAATRVPEDARRPAARARDPAPARRRLLRSAGAARRFRARRAGLLGAVRAGRVMVVERARHRRARVGAWLGFLPAVAERLLGEKLLLPSVATWWCGERPALEYVLANLDRLVIKPDLPEPALRAGVRPRARRGKARDALIARLRSTSLRLRGAGARALSQAPVWSRGRVRARRARAHHPRVRGGHADGVRVMPGGLARVANEARPTWSPRSAAAAPRTSGCCRRMRTRKRSPTCSAATARAAPQRQDYIPSRLVENLYWLGRYSVRCERTTARLLLRTLARAASGACGRMRGRSAAISARRSPPDAECDARRRGDSEGLHADISQLAWCASQVRNRLSARYWRGVVGLQRQMQEAAATRGSSREVYERVLLALAALTGFSEEDMMHDEGWRVMRLGRRIERMQFVAASWCRISSTRVRDPAAQDGRVAARRLRQHAYLPHALRSSAAPRIRCSNLLVLRRPIPARPGFPVAIHSTGISTVSRARSGRRSTTRWRTRSAISITLISGRCDASCGEEGADARRTSRAQLDRVALAAGELSDRLSRALFLAHRDEIHTR